MLVIIKLLSERLNHKICFIGDIFKLRSVLSLTLKKSLFLFFLAGCLFSCSSILPKEKLYNTEIECADGFKLLVKFARIEDLRQGIISAYNEKIKNKSNEKYTVVKLKNGESFKIPKIPPEKMLECYLLESEFGVADPKYVHVPVRY